MQELSLFNRMKNYESIVDYKLMPKQPVIIRLDGKAFHTYTKGLDKPFDMDLSKAFEFVCMELKEQISGVKFIYTQSDEISLLLTDWDKINTQNWLQYRIQKLTSLVASLATSLFNKYIESIVDKYYKLYNSRDIDYDDEQYYLEKYKLWKSKKYKANFDARAFNLPLNEVCNYFIWRQQDAIRNSIQSLGQSLFSHNELINKSCEDVILLSKEKFSIDWSTLSTRQQRGFCLYKDIEVSEWIIDNEIPLFTSNRTYIDKFLL